MHSTGSSLLIHKRLAGRLAAPAALLLALAACAGDGAAGEADAPAAALAVAVLPARAQTSFERALVLTGRVEARRASEVGFELGGLLAAVAVDEGDRVAAGQNLASLDRARLRSQRAEAAASLAQIEAQAALAAATFERVREALDFRGVSQQQYDEAANAVTAAGAAADSARARLARIDVDLDKSTLLAPYDAVVTARHADEGQVLQPGQRVLSLHEDAPPTVRIGVAGAGLEALSPGAAYTLEVNGQPVAAVVRRILPQRDPVSRTVDVLLEVQAGDAARVRSGDLARLTLTRTIDGAGVWLPLDALAEGSRGLWTAYVAVPRERRELGATHQVEPRAVELVYQRADSAYVRGALRDGDRVIQGGLQRIVPGQFVRVSEGGP